MNEVELPEKNEAKCKIDITVSIKVNIYNKWISLRPFFRGFYGFEVSVVHALWATQRRRSGRFYNQEAKPFLGSCTTEDENKIRQSK